MTTFYLSDYSEDSRYSCLVTILNFLRSTFILKETNVKSLRKNLLNKLLIFVVN